ncbi:hypothetical protein PRIPAC_86238 [Pristionchus pacificus]|nr:hypothetical protein PRIPAC_86238 [Pristionchus pacificus]|eukprot:PDM68924.1 hypothetical protein PRIPAC_47226 [Pristionchus pacificus]
MNDISDSEEQESTSNSEEDSDYDDNDVFVRRPKKFLIIGSDGLCIEDHLSHCPDLCLLKIFNFLSRPDLFNVTSVNKRLLPLYFDKSLNNRKWGNGHLSIYPTLSGYFFDLVVGIDGYPWSEEEYGNYAWFEYEIQKSEDGSFIEKRTMNARREYFLEFPPDNPHYWPIPDAFFTAMAEILRHHEATKVRIENVPLTIFTKMEKILDGHCTQSISCAKVHFTQLVKRVRVIDLKDAPELFQLIDEDFMCSIAHLEVYDRQMLTSPYADLAYVHRFTPSDSILQHIIHFQWLELLSMELDSDWVAPLIMARMEASIKGEFEQRCTWKFALDRPLTSDIISQTVRHADYKYTELDDVHFLSTKDQARHAKIYSEQYLVGDGTAILNVVQINVLNACSFN